MSVRIRLTADVVAPAVIMLRSVDITGRLVCVAVRANRRLPPVLPPPR